MDRRRFPSRRSSAVGTSRRTAITSNCRHFFAEGQRHFRGILNRLQRDRLDNLAIHGINRPEHLTWALEGEGRALLDWVLETDQVDQVGFSSHGSQALIRAAIDSNRFQFCNLHLHLLDPQRLPLAEQAIDQGMGVLAISPADKGGRLQDPSPTLIEDCAPIQPLAGYRSPARASPPSAWGPPNHRI